MGVLMGLARTNARALPGDRAYDFKTFYRGSKGEHPTFYLLQGDKPYVLVQELRDLTKIAAK